MGDLRCDYQLFEFNHVKHITPVYVQRIPENRKLPILPVCMVLHMDMREYGSFLFSGFPCISSQRGEKFT